MASPATMPHETKRDVQVDAISSPQDDSASYGYGKEETLEAREIFHKGGEEGVDFRTVSWQRATVIFIKIQFAMSILAVPGALAALGAVGGALSIVGWQSLNTCEWRPFNLDEYQKC